MKNEDEECRKKTYQEPRIDVMPNIIDLHIEIQPTVDIARFRMSTGERTIQYFHELGCLPV